MHSPSTALFYMRGLTYPVALMALRAKKFSCCVRAVWPSAPGIRMLWIHEKKAISCSTGVEAGLLPKSHPHHRSCTRMNI